MNESIEKNRDILKTDCITAHISGLLLLIVSIIGMAVEILSGSFVKVYSYYVPPTIQIPFMIPEVALNITFLGLVALGLAQFIKYVFENQSQIGLILRIGDKILYVYAGFVILVAFLKWVFQMEVTEVTATLLVSFIALILPAAAKALILIIFGKTLHRVLPVIGKSKTLVCKEVER